MGRLLATPSGISPKRSDNKIAMAIGAVLASVWVLMVHACGTGYVHQPHEALSRQPIKEGLHDSPRPWQGELFVRTELFFGSAKADGSDVSEEAFQRFLDTEVTPRFPEGLTLFSGRGQFRNSIGTIVEERAKMLILLYPVSTREDSSLKIEQIRHAYKKAFQQESVMRADHCCEEVGF